MEELDSLKHTVSRRSTSSDSEIRLRLEIGVPLVGYQADAQAITSRHLIAQTLLSWRVKQ